MTKNVSVIVELPFPDRRLNPNSSKGKLLAATVALRKDARFDDLPVIAMTAHALAEIRERCLSEGMQDYITKPVEPEKLVATLARWMGKAMPARAVLPAPDLAPLPGLAGIDSSFGLRNVGGNSALYVELLDRFRASQRDAGCSIRGDLDAGRLVDVASRAHALRGVAGNIGARELQSLAQEIEEEAGRPAPDAAALARSAAALEDAVATLMDSLDCYFANTHEVPAALPAGGAGQAQDDGPDGLDAVAQLERLLAEFSGEATDYFDSVRAPLARLLGPGLLTRLESHLSRYEFEEARAVLAQAHGASDSIAEHI